MFRKLSSMVELLTTEYGRSALHSGHPRSLASSKICWQLHRLCPSIATLIDGGANVGQFSRAFRSFFPEADIFAFEPLPAAAAEFRKNLRNERGVELFESCLGSKSGSVTFFENKYSQVSSALPIEPDRRDIAGYGGHTLERTLPITTLDAVFMTKRLKPPVLIKLDLQGYELEALKGAAGILPQCTYVLIETVFERVYSGEPRFEEIWEYLRGWGYTFRKPLAFQNDPRAGLFQMDALMERVKDVRPETRNADL